MVALLTPLRAEIRSTDALRRSSSCISSIAAARTASRRSSLRGPPRARLGVIPLVSLYGIRPAALHHQWAYSVLLRFSNRSLRDALSVTRSRLEHFAQPHLPHVS